MFTYSTVACVLHQILVLFPSGPSYVKRLFEISFKDVPCKTVPTIKKPPMRRRKPTAKVLQRKDTCRICHQNPAKLKHVMVECERCGQWFHYKCVNIGSHKEAEEMEFICPDACF